MPSASKVDADGLQNDGPQMEACSEGWGCIKRGSPQIENEHGYQCTHKVSMHCYIVVVICCL